MHRALAKVKNGARHLKTLGDGAADPLARTALLHGIVRSGRHERCAVFSAFRRAVFMTGSNVQKVVVSKPTRHFFCESAQALWPATGHTVRHVSFEISTTMV